MRRARILDWVRMRRSHDRYNDVEPSSPPQSSPDYTIVIRGSNFREGQDDGYDISAYRDVHPDHGTLSDFRQFVRAAHARGIRVITELVVNHTSDQHPWFQRARRAKPGSPLRNFYVWSDNDQKYAGTRIIFIDAERSNWAWDPVAGAYYWHRFYSHQPDLNFDNPQVLKTMLGVMR